MGRTADYYKKNPKARKKKYEYDKKYNKKPSSVKKRVECIKFRRENGTYGNGGDKDCSHKGGSLVMENRRINRARGGAKKK